MNQDNQNKNPNEEDEQKLRERKIKQLNQVVCICNGVKLERILKVIGECKTVADVNKKAGTGSGGCKATRCGPRIKLLLQKFAEKKANSTDTPDEEQSEKP